MKGLLILDDSFVCRREVIEFLGPQTVLPFATEDWTRTPATGLRNLAQFIVDTITGYRTDIAAAAININWLIARDGPHGKRRRQDRFGLLIAEAMRIDPCFLIPVYAYSFEPRSFLAKDDIFKILFIQFADCNRFFRLPFSRCDFIIQPPNERHIQALAEALRIKRRERRRAEVAAALREILLRFAHNQETDLTALVGPAKAALRSGYYHLAASPGMCDTVRSSLDQLKGEVNLLGLESCIQEAVLNEIGQLESLWGAAVRGIIQVRGFSESPEMPPDCISELALERLRAFEKRILELQEG